MVLAGEITTNAHVDYIQVARDTIKRIGYDNTEYGIDYKGCAVMVCYDKQSNDIAQGVDKAFETRTGERDDEIDDQGAGDQGMMFGYACDENDAMMPTPIHLAHRLAERLAEVEPFKTAIILNFVRAWPFVAYAVALLVAGLFVERFYCRYLCPLGAALAIPAVARFTRSS